jgi:hypothetical protein
VLAASAAAHHPANFVTAFVHTMDSDVMSKAANARSQLDILASSRTRDAFAIPSFMYLSKRLADGLAHAHALRQACAGVTVGGSHPRDKVSPTTDEAANRACPTGETASFSEIRECSPYQVSRLA